MKDFLGRPLKVGQRVIIERTTYKGLIEGTVVRLTPKGATVSHRSPYSKLDKLYETNRPSHSIYGVHE